MTRVLYPGTFDPMTNGQLDIALRAARLFDHLIIGVYAGPGRKFLFTVEERIHMVRQAIAHAPNISVISYDSLTVECARRTGAQAIVRGLRVISDFEHEFQMALMSRELAPDIDFVCLMTSIEHTYLSSSIVKEIALLGGDVSPFVPPHVVDALRRRLETLGKDGEDKVNVISLKDG
ncbi:MAG: pantetheine-phosphate adenylyltransferase [Ardenticatenia bacterium]|nr:pantetheine-phosphate adenylyltransferase [Ardenticatenia bacterium]